MDWVLRDAQKIMSDRHGIIQVSEDDLKGQTKVTMFSGNKSVSVMMSVSGKSSPRYFITATIPHFIKEGKQVWEPYFGYDSDKKYLSKVLDELGFERKKPMWQGTFM